MTLTGSGAGATAGVRGTDAQMPTIVDAAAAGTPKSRMVALVAGALVIAGFGAVATAYAVVQPFGQPSDEGAHFEYARLISDHWALPGATMAEKQQPPLYYLISAALLRAGVPAQGLRAVGVICGVAFVLLTMVVASRLLRRGLGVGVLAGAFIAVLPGAQSVAGSVSDDPLAWVVGAGIVLILVETLRRPTPTLGLTVMQGLVIAAGLLAKETVWPMIAVLVVAIVAQWRERLGVTHVAAVLGLPAVLSGWWFVRNLVSFHRLTPPLGPIEPKTPTEHLLRSTGQVKVAAGGLARSLFGPETGPVGPLPRSSWALGLIVVLIVGGCGLAAAQLWKIGRDWPRLSTTSQRIVIALAACVVAVAVAWVANGVLIDLQPRARYLLVIGPAGAALLALPTAQAFLRWRRATLLVGAAAACALAAVTVDALRVAAQG